jgi:hypothetical protein
MPQQEEIREYVLREGRIIARLVTEADLGDQPALVAQLLNENRSCLLSDLGTTKYGRYTATADTSSGMFQYVLINLGDVLKVQSIMLAEWDDGSLTLCPHERPVGLTHGKRLIAMSAFPAQVRFVAGTLILCCRLSDTARQYALSPETRRLWIREAGTYYPAPLPHVDDSAAFCTGAAPCQNKLHASLSELVEALVRETIIESQWRGHWNPSLGKDYDADIQLKDGEADIVMKKIGRAKAPPSWWHSRMTYIP